MSAEEFMQRIQTTCGEQALAVSAIGFTEMLHGLYREPDRARRILREAFFAELFSSLPVVPYTQHIAAFAARIGAEQANLGRTVPPVDLMIGATALSLGFSILTSNERHFRLIPGLQVITF
jgi:tRNA(fMet)-specific endonuclease VapC